MILYPVSMATKVATQYQNLKNALIYGIEWQHKCVGISKA